MGALALKDARMELKTTKEAKDVDSPYKLSQCSRRILSH